MARLLAFLSYIYFLFSVEAQPGILQLANEYYADGQYVKARATYEEILKDSKKWDMVYPNYLQCLYKLNDFKTAEKSISRMIKTFPDYPPYKIDLVECLELQNKGEQAKKMEEKIINETVRSMQYISLTADYFMTKKKPLAAEQLYLRSRKFMANDKLYSNELAELYKTIGDKSKLMKEILVLIQNEEVEKIKNQLQNYLNEPEDYEKLETALIQRIQENPENKRYTDLLIWLYIQQKDFESAFFQAKAQDKRLKLQGYQLYDLQKICFENQKHDMVVKIYQYLNQELPKSNITSQAKLLSIKSREYIISNTYPISKEEVRSLIKDYEQLITESKLSNESYEIKRNIASLHAFYLNQPDTAIAILQNLIKIQVYNETQLAKLLLADIYLLTGEPWESSLLYMQVEKEKKDDLIGYEAKLKNAKLFFYNHEFELAQEQLDVLKQATSREIANDALQLSLLISNSLAADSNTTPLEIYSSAYFFYQIRRFEEAIKKLEEIEKNWKDHPLQEQSNWIKYQIFYKSKNYEKAKYCLEVIDKNPSENAIYADDAVYELGKLYQEVFKDNTAATEYFQKLITNYPGSVYVVESRKRIRAIRGDKNF